MNAQVKNASSKEEYQPEDFLHLNYLSGIVGIQGVISTFSMTIGFSLMSYFSLGFLT